MVGEGDIVQVNGTGPKLKVNEFHYVQLPHVDPVRRTPIAQCLVPNPKTGEYDDLSLFENHVAATLTVVEAPKPAKGGKPEKNQPAGKPQGEPEDGE